MSEHKSILLEAEGLVHGDRNEDYGHPLNDFSCTTMIWSAMMQRKYPNFPMLAADDVGLMMVGLKLSRQTHKPKRDNLVDIAGYAETVAWIYDEIEKHLGDDVLTETFHKIDVSGGASGK